MNAVNQSDQTNRRRCLTCRHADRIRVGLPTYSSEYYHDGKIHSVTVANLEVWQCTDAACSAIVLDDAAEERLEIAVRDQLGLLSPQEIQQQRERLGLSQTQLATTLRMPDNLVAQLESVGFLQPRDTDTLLRLFFKLPQVRDELGHMLGQGQPTRAVPIAGVPNLSSATEAGNSVKSFEKMPTS